MFLKLNFINKNNEQIIMFDGMFLTVETTEEDIKNYISFLKDKYQLNNVKVLSEFVDFIQIDTNDIILDKNDIEHDDYIPYEEIIKILGYMYVYGEDVVKAYYSWYNQQINKKSLNVFLDNYYGKFQTLKDFKHHLMITYNDTHFFTEEEMKSNKFLQDFYLWVKYRNKFYIFVKN